MDLQANSFVMEREMHFLSKAIFWRISNRVAAGWSLSYGGLHIFSSQLNRNILMSSFALSSLYVLILSISVYLYIELTERNLLNKIFGKIRLESLPFIRRNKIKPTKTFSELVAYNVISARATGLGFALGIISCLYPTIYLSSFSFEYLTTPVLVSIACVITFAVDMAVIGWRARSGVFGNIDIEVIEAVQFVSQQNRQAGKGGGGRFTGVFRQVLGGSQSIEAITPGLEGVKP